MYCRCPECQTVFSITSQQLQERNGLVRCGHCTTVFRGDQNLVGSPAAAPAKPVKAPVAVPTPAESSTPISTAADATTPALPEFKIDTRPRRHIRPDQTQLSRDEARDILKELTGRRPGQRTRPVYWGLGSLVLLLLVCAQTLYYYRDNLAWHPQLGSYIHQACEFAGCTIAPRQDVALIELTGTSVAPHPKFKSALRIKATLINRAKYEQPFPHMEVKLTNRRGETTSRRLFGPDNYLDKEERTSGSMSRNTANRIQLDVTSPDDATEGYEIRLVAQ
ncbi:MAG: zinc-ribbon and DUF3426 domain-containing protein [Gammaproteobacteria bacterium]|nr:zinc-ribbon and DUF3426 domain-containing protein [Gammaproteobacteria bacterium]